LPKDVLYVLQNYFTTTIYNPFRLVHIKKVVIARDLVRSYFVKLITFEIYYNLNRRNSLIN